MKINTVEIKNFRNIQNEKIELSPELTVISGMNGQGKTNILESIWMLTGAKSFRGAKDLQLISHGLDFATINAYTKEDEKNIRIIINKQDNTKTTRKAQINGVEYARAGKIAGVVTAIVFEPNHLKLIKSSPAERRNFIDTALCQLYPGYINLLRKYTRLITQKNSLLKQFYNISGAKDLLDVYNDSIAETGEKISLKRQSYINEIKEDIIKNYGDISQKKEKLSLEYNACFNENENTLLKLIKQNEKKEIGAGHSLIGPHREDFTIKIDEKEARTFASQGQQRSAVLALKLAESSVFLNITGENPIMLFDDVLSELDDARQTYILNNIKNKQTVVTACDISLFNKTSGKIYIVENGKTKI